MPLSTRAPSKGGTGNRLKIANPTLIHILALSMPNRGMAMPIASGESAHHDGPGNHFMANADATASNRFIAGPARATQIMSVRGRRRLWGLTGTGLAHPMTGVLVIMPN